MEVSRVQRRWGVAPGVSAQDVASGTTAATSLCWVNLVQKSDATACCWQPSVATIAAVRPPASRHRGSSSASKPPMSGLGRKSPDPEQIRIGIRKLRQLATAVNRLDLPEPFHEPTDHPHGGVAGRLPGVHTESEEADSPGRKERHRSKKPGGHGHWSRSDSPTHFRTASVTITPRRALEDESIHAAISAFSGRGPLVRARRSRKGMSHAGRSARIPRSQ